MNNTISSIQPDFALEMLNLAPQGVVLCQNDGTVRWVNQTLAAWLTAPISDLVGKQFDSLLQHHFNATNESDSTVVTVSSEGDLPARWLRYTTIALEISGQSYSATYFVDISQEHQLLEQLETIEPVSRLLNRRAMMQNLEPLISRSRRYENPLSVITMELLNLEEIGTEQGDAKANQVVLELSHLLKDQLRWADIISRTDNKHIVIILPETGKEDAGRLAEKINSQVAELHTQNESVSDVKLQACYGVAAWEKGNDSLLLLRNANQAMARARDQGIGVVEIA